MKSYRKLKQQLSEKREVVNDVEYIVNPSNRELLGYLKRAEAEFLDEYGELVGVEWLCRGMRDLETGDDYFWTGDKYIHRHFAEKVLYIMDWDDHVDMGIHPHSEGGYILDIFSHGHDEIADELADKYSDLFVKVFA